MGGIRILIVDDIAETRENIEKLLGLEKDFVVVGHAGNGEEALQQVGELSPDIVLMDINMPLMDGITASEHISTDYPGVSVVILSVQGEVEYVKKAMAAGARDYLVKPFSADDLADTLRRVHKAEEIRRNAQLEKLQLEQKSNAAMKGVGEEAHPQGSQVITLYSLKGGVGKSTIAANLAIALAQKSRKKVLLVDLDLMAGDICVLLNLMPKAAIGELAQDMANGLDADLLESFLMQGPAGIKVLAAPVRPEYAEIITAHHIEAILKLARKLYDYVVVDTPVGFGEINLAAFDSSDQILLVMGLDLPTIKNVRIAMEVLDGLRHKAKIKLVLNRVSNEFSLRVDDVEASLNFLVAAQLPSEGKTVVPSVNRGVPFYLSSPGSRIATAVGELAQMVIEDKGHQKDLESYARRKGLMSRIFG